MRLNLGCGRDIRGPRKNWLNVDQRIPPSYETNATQRHGVFRIYETAENGGQSAWFRRVDLDDTPWPWEDESATHILASHVLEHLDDVVAFMDEAHRVLCSGGILEVRVPHYQHPNAHQDPTHKHTFTEGSMDYFLEARPDHLEPLGDGRWHRVSQAVDLGFTQFPSRYRAWALRLYKTFGIPQPRGEEITWKLTPIKED